MLGQFFVQGWAPDPLLWAQHDPWLVLPSIFASWVALRVLMRPVLSAPVLWAAAVLVGAGIGTMHYVGMAASELAPFMRYDLGALCCLWWWPWCWRPWRCGCALGCSGFCRLAPGPTGCWLG